MILYEYPFNERVRTYLRLEHLFRRLGELVTRAHPLDHHFALATIFEVMDVAARADLNEFLYARFGYPASADAALYMTLIDEDGHYSPFLLRAEKPTFQVSNKALVRQIVFPLWNCVLQSATKTANFTVTTSTRLLYADTASGSITFALPAVAGVNANTVFSFVKTASANNMVLDPSGSETIENASTLTVTAQYERVDVYTDGSAWYRL